MALLDFILGAVMPSFMQSQANQRQDLAAGKSPYSEDSSAEDTGSGDFGSSGPAGHMGMSQNAFSNALGGMGMFGDKQQQQQAPAQQAPPAAQPQFSPYPDWTMGTPIAQQTPSQAEREGGQQTYGQWKAQYAPNDSGQDYDLQGAYQAGIIPDETGHMPDRFKMPGHPTFSVESQYYKPGMAAGRWEGDQFVPYSGDVATAEHEGGLTPAGKSPYQMPRAMAPTPTVGALQQQQPGGGFTARPTSPYDVPGFAGGWINPNQTPGGGPVPPQQQAGILDQISKILSSPMGMGAAQAIATGLITPRWVGFGGTVGNMMMGGLKGYETGVQNQAYAQQQQTLADYHRQQALLEQQRINIQNAQLRQQQLQTDRYNQIWDTLSEQEKKQAILGQKTNPTLWSTLIQAHNGDAKAALEDYKTLRPQGAGRESTFDSFRAEMEQKGVKYGSPEFNAEWERRQRARQEQSPANVRADTREKRQTAQQQVANRRHAEQDYQAWASKTDEGINATPAQKRAKLKEFYEKYNAGEPPAAPKQDWKSAFPPIE